MKKKLLILFLLFLVAGLYISWKVFGPTITAPENKYFYIRTGATYDEVKKNLSKLDGTKVLAQARSKSGLMQIESITTPHLPQNAFNKDIKKLINLDEKFNSIFMDKYFDLAGATLDGLSEEQIETITQRPTLDEVAFNF